MNLLLALIPGGLMGRVIALAAFAAAVLAGYAYWHHQVDAGGYARAEGEQAQRDISLAKRSIRILDLTISAQQELNDEATATQKVLSDAVESVALERDRVIASLRDRTSRPAPSPAGQPDAAPAESATSCTGATLYREDGEFLAREAARADRILSELDACQRQYGDAEVALKRFLASVTVINNAAESGP